MIDLRHLRTLHALRETDSLHEAAERLHLTQSALSHQFRDMEERIGMPLFVRKSRPVRFTSAGLKLLQLADQVLPQIRNTERDLGKLAGGCAGRLHIAIECHSCYQWLMPSVDEFRGAWPEVELDLASGFSFAPLPALEPADIASQTLITYPIERTRLDIFTRFLDPADVEPAQVRTSELTVMMMQLVASGRGVCCLPNWAVHEYSSRGYVTAKRLGEHGLQANLYAALRSDMLEVPYVRDFLLTAKDISFTTLAGVSVPSGQVI